MKETIFIGAALLLLSCNVSAKDRHDGADGTASQDGADIQHVMEAFHHAVATHDGRGVAELFLDPGSTWVTVLSDQAFASARAKNPSAQKVRVSSYRDFAAFVARDRKSVV